MTDNNNPIKYSDLVKPDNSITDLINQLDQLSDAYMNTLKNIKSEAISVRAGFGICGKRERKAVGRIEASPKGGERNKQTCCQNQPIRRGFI